MDAGHGGGYGYAGGGYGYAFQGEPPKKNQVIALHWAAGQGMGGDKSGLVNLLLISLVYSDCSTRRGSVGAGIGGRR